MVSSPTTTSTFNVSLMPAGIQRRTLHPFSVHFSTQTGRWIATIVKLTEWDYHHHQALEGETKRCIQTAFATEREAKKFAKSFSPPKLEPPRTECTICCTNFNAKFRTHHCRNCGVFICDKCSIRWSCGMIPKTYVARSQPQAVTVRICKNCDWLSNAFCMALLQGKHEDAVTLVETGNVNLRTTFAGINREAMFPVHCAVLGGNIETLKWLVDGHCCPIAIKRDSRTGRMQSVQTSSMRTLVELAMTGKAKLDILRYLVMDKKLSVLDAIDPKLAPRALEALLRAGVPKESAEESITGGAKVHIIDDASEHSGSSLENACVLCYERNMDCVLIPCGHQVCCQECGKHLDTCPVCKVNCSVLRIFRQ